jgi:hypothetical protein
MAYISPADRAQVFISKESEAARARVLSLHRALGHASEATILAGLRSGAFEDLDISPSDVHAASLKQCTGCNRGKNMFRKRPEKPRPRDRQPTFGEHWHCDLLKIDWASFFIAVEEMTNYIWHERVNSKSTRDLRTTLANLGGFTRATRGSMKLSPECHTFIHSDGEKGLSASLTKMNLKEFGMEHVRLAPEAHDKLCERYNGVIKDRVRSTFFGLAAEMGDDRSDGKGILDPTLLDFLVNDCILGINLSPNSATGARSPWRTVFGEGVRGLCLQSSFGMAVDFQATRRPNNLSSRSFRGIILERDPRVNRVTGLILHDGQLTKRDFERFAPIRDPLTRRQVLLSTLAAGEGNLRDLTVLQEVVDGTGQAFEPDCPVVFPAGSDVNPEAVGSSSSSPDSPFGIGDPKTQTATPVLPSGESRTPSVGSQHLAPDCDLGCPPSGGVDRTPRAVVAGPASASFGSDVASAEGVCGGARDVCQDVSQPATVSPGLIPSEVSHSANLSFDGFKLYADLSWSASAFLAVINGQGACAAQKALISVIREGAGTLGHATPILVTERERLAALSELEQMRTYEVFAPVDASKLTPRELGEAIPTVMLLIDKTFPDGTFDKTKGRFVIKGFKDRGDPGPTDSPTVHRDLVMLTLHIFVSLGYAIIIFDVKAAFLEAPLEGRTVYAYIDRDLADYVINLDKSLASGKLENGDLVVKLKKALYGLREAPRAWFLRLKKALLSFGFQQSTHDQCLFFKRVAAGLVIVLTHVDDMLCIGPRELLEELRTLMKKEFKQITEKVDPDEFPYLGFMAKYDRKARTLELRQTKYIDLLKDKIGDHAGRTPSAPATQDLFHVDERSPLLSAAKARTFKSAVALALWLISSRPDIRCAVAFLTTRTKPTEQDFGKLIHLVDYLVATKDRALTIKASDLSLHGSADASFAVHANDRMKGHTGGLLWLGKQNAPIATFCSKQKLVAHSSTEAELVALDCVAVNGLFILDTLKELGLAREDSKLRIEQDNKSAIQLAKNGYPSTTDSRSITIKYHWISIKIEDGKLELVDTRTNTLLADGFTKPLVGEAFARWRDRVLNSKS